MSLPKSGRLATARLERLEERQLLAADGLQAADDGVDAVSAAPLSPSESGETVALETSDTLVSLQLPSDLPQQFSAAISIDDATLTLELEKNSVFGENTRILVDDGTGELVQIDHGPDGTYLGRVAEHPEYSVVAVLGEAGLRASITRPGLSSLSIEPANGTHRVFEADAEPISHDHDGDGVPDHAPEDHPNGTSGGHPPGCTCTGCCAAASQGVAASQGPVADAPVAPLASEIDDEAPRSEAATLAPSRVVDVYEYEVGVEISSRAFVNNYGSDLALAQSVAQGIAANMDARYLHSTGIKHRVGTVIIRTNPATDPLNVANGNDSAGLSAFRSYWNDLQANEGIAPTHDLAVYHVQGAPSGLAYVNQVGTGSRYALSASNGATSWADGTLAHEFGHTWSLAHVGSHSFYESKPRSNGNAPGGDDVFVSVMHGGGDHNIGRLATDEANRVYNVKLNKLQFGDLIANPEPIKPFGHRDSFEVGTAPVVLDVVANDYDANNDVLNVQLRDTVSQQGGTISVSSGTGPGGRDELIYTPPAVFSGNDFFHYNVIDSTGRTDWGAVYITSASIGVDLGQDDYAYDFGTTDSPVFSNDDVQAIRVSPATVGDVTWGGPVQAVDRGSSAGNAYNRDLVYGTTPVSWSHKIQNGRWRVTVNMSDSSNNLDNMFVIAEGAIGLSDLDRPIGQNQTVSFEVEVLDGELDLTFGDADANNSLWALNRVVLAQLEEYIPPVLEGDYNNDGIVNAIDYTIYRDTLSQAVANPYDGADGDGDRAVDADDHAVWGVNYGAELVTTSLIDATTGNGEVAVDDANDVSLFGGGTDTATIVLSRDRAFRNVGTAGRGISVDGWDIERVSYGGSNAAYGTDGLYGFAQDAGTGPGQTGQFFVNSGVIDIRSDAVAGGFEAGEQINLSYLLGSDTNGASETVEATASLVFDEGLATERTHTFPVRSATGLATPAITEQYRIPLAASTVSVHFNLDGVQVGVRALLDQVELSWTRSTANAGASNLDETAALAIGAVSESSPAVEESEPVAAAQPVVAPALSVASNSKDSFSGRRVAPVTISAASLDPLLLYRTAAFDSDGSPLDAEDSEETSPSREDRDEAFESLDLSVL
ncbi:Beta-agarase A precursor [Planctomycetes bacterium MalM25]|nr:Beta-agarase A precursor [Planctomycetes bacterium MalM25]